MTEQLGSYIRETLAALVRINSINPAFDPAAPGEGPIGEWIARELERLGCSVTRHGVHVDRMASAWLIRRFIDPEATFKFVPARGYRPEAGELRFDMYQAEYTHEGERCTFQVLVRRFGLSNPALEAIGEIIRDIDCKDSQHGRAETAGIAALIAGIAEAGPDDPARISQSAPVFDGLLRHFSARPE